MSPSIQNTWKPALANAQPRNPTNKITKLQEQNRNTKHKAVQPIHGKRGPHEEQAIPSQRKNEYRKMIRQRNTKEHNSGY